MKFQFKEGQWFDARKLTDWQKQWCLDNLEFVESGRDHFINNTFPYYKFKFWKELNGCGFGSTHNNYNNELTFNDFYWEEEVSQESIFDKPRWVTVKGDDGDTTSFFGYQLVCGKDYKVVNKSEGGYGIQLTPTKVIEVAEEYFHKVTPQDLLPEEVEYSFDNLVFIQPLVFGASVPLKNLSDEQLMFIADYFDLDQPSSHKTHFTCLSTTGERYFSSPVYGCNPCYNLSFNDIFKEVN